MCTYGIRDRGTDIDGALTGNNRLSAQITDVLFRHYCNGLQLHVCL